MSGVEENGPQFQEAPVLVPSSIHTDIVSSPFVIWT